VIGTGGVVSRQSTHHPDSAMEEAKALSPHSTAITTTSIATTITTSSATSIATTTTITPSATMSDENENVTHEDSGGDGGARDQGVGGGASPIQSPVRGVDDENDQI